MSALKIRRAQPRWEVTWFIRSFVGSWGAGKEQREMGHLAKRQTNKTKTKNRPLHVCTRRWTEPIPGLYVREWVWRPLVLQERTMMIIVQSDLKWNNVNRPRKETVKCTINRVHDLNRGCKVTVSTAANPIPRDSVSRLLGKSGVWAEKD